MLLLFESDSQDEVWDPHGEERGNAARLRTMRRIAGRTMQAMLCLMRFPAIDGPANHCCYQPNHNNKPRGRKS